MKRCYNCNIELNDKDTKSIGIKVESKQCNLVDLDNIEESNNQKYICLSCKEINDFLIDDNISVKNNKKKQDKIENEKKNKKNTENIICMNCNIYFEGIKCSKCNYINPLYVKKKKKKKKK